MSNTLRGGFVENIGFHHIIRNGGKEYVFLTAIIVYYQANQYELYQARH